MRIVGQKKQRTDTRPSVQKTKGPGRADNLDVQPRPDPLSEPLVDPLAQHSSSGETSSQGDAVQCDFSNVPEPSWDWKKLGRGSKGRRKGGVDPNERNPSMTADDILPNEPKVDPNGLAQPDNDSWIDKWFANKINEFMKKPSDVPEIVRQAKETFGFGKKKGASAPRSKEPGELRKLFEFLADKLKSDPPKPPEEKPQPASEPPKPARGKPKPEKKPEKKPDPDPDGDPFKDGEDELLKPEKEDGSESLRA